MLSIVTPASSTQLTTPADASAELGVTGADARVGKLIDRASAAIATFCRRGFGSATVTETLAVQCGPILLARVPITSIAFIAIDGAAIDNSLYTADLAAGILELHRAARGRRLAITYTAGYRLPADDADDALPDLPADVQAACIEAVKALWFSGGDGARDPNVRSDQVEGVSGTSYFDPIPGAGMLPPAAVEMLAPYRLPVC